MDFITFQQHITHIIAIDLIHFMCELQMCVYEIWQKRRHPIADDHEFMQFTRSYYGFCRILKSHMYLQCLQYYARLYTLNTVMVTTFKEWSVNGFEIKTFLDNSILMYVMLKHYSMLAQSSKRLLQHDKTRHKHSLYFIIYIEWHASLW